MARHLAFSLLLVALSGVAYGQAPDSTTIQFALNESLELEFPFFQEFTDVVIVRGGVTAEGTYLFLCTARLMWKLDSTELAATLQQEIDNEVQQQGGDEALWRAMTEALGIRLSLIAPFQAGGTVSNVRLRLRMEQGGTDWIISELELRESNRNPLSVLDPIQ